MEQLVEQDEEQNSIAFTDGNSLTKVQKDLKEAVEKFLEIRTTMKTSTATFVQEQKRYMEEKKLRRKTVSDFVKLLHRDLFPNISKYTAEHGYIVADWIFENCLGMHRNSDGSFDEKYWKVNSAGYRLSEKSFTDEYSSLGEEIQDIIRNAIKTMNASAKEFTSTNQVTFKDPLEEAFGEPFEESSRKTLNSIIVSESWKLETLIEAALDYSCALDYSSINASNSELASKDNEDKQVCLCYAVSKIL